MKNRIFVILLLFIQSFCINSPVSAMQPEPEDTQREKRLSRGLSEVFGIGGITINGDQLIITGDQSQVESALAKLNNFDVLRKTVVPFSKVAVTTRAHQAQNFSCWQDCALALGVPLEELSNFAINKEFDVNNTLQIPYDFEFNKSVADAYVKEIKKRSSYFDWISRHNSQLLQYTDSMLYINYGLLTEHFCAPQVDYQNLEGAVSASLSLHAVLNKLSAAAGSDISLVPTDVPGQYHVRTVMHGADQVGRQNAPLSIDFALDISGSMGGNPINTINQTMPKLLEEFRNNLKADEMIDISVYVFNDDMRLHQNYTLKSGDRYQIRWENLDTGGGTNLTTVGNLLKRSHDEERRIVIAFTDGQNTTGDINASYEYMQQLQSQNKFAQPFFWNVGNNAQEPYFDKVSSIFAGSCQKAATVQKFCEYLHSNIQDLLVPNVPMVLTIGGMDVTVRQTCGKPDIHTTSQILKEKDSIQYRGAKFVVTGSSHQPKSAATNVSTSSSSSSGTHVETTQQQIERLETELARLRLEAMRQSDKSDGSDSKK